MTRLIASTILSILLATTALAQSTATYEAGRFYDSFSGTPESPEAWYSRDWDRTTHVRDINNFYELVEVEAQHGLDCSGPPNTHSVTAYEDTVFRCRDHVMTAINGPGYGLIELMPRYMVDFSQGEAVVQFRMSTKRDSGRDWVDVFLSPFEDHLQLPFNDGQVDLQGEPRNGISFKMNMIKNNSIFEGFRMDNFESSKLPGTEDHWKGYEYVLTQDAKRRDLFELRISKTHVKFGMPEYDFWWVDTDIPELSWDRAVVQLGHHSYNPTKLCFVDPPCSPTTWHWDDVSIEPAIPFALIPGSPRYVDETNPVAVNFESPAPPESFLRFSAIGLAIEISVDGGGSWSPAVKQDQEFDAEDHFSSYFTPIPAGTQSVMIRGQDWYATYWHARSFSIVSETIGVSLPIELVQLTAEAVDRDILLAWTTSSETDNSGFEIQHEIGGVFERIGFVAGAGTSTETRSYAYTAKDLAPGNHRFRLRQIDFDGSHTFSAVVEAAIDLPAAPQVSDAYPNPFSQTTTISLLPPESGNYRVEVFDRLGRQVQTAFDGHISAETMTKVSLNATGLPSGIYFYRVSGKGVAHVGSVSIQ